MTTGFCLDVAGTLAEMADNREEERDPSEAIDEIREKREEGDEPSSEEQEFLESERVDLDPGEGDDTPVA